MTEQRSDRFASVALFIAAAFWGLYWLPLRLLSAEGLPETWSVALFNACPLIVLGPYIALRWSIAGKALGASLAIGFFTGVGLGLYASGLAMSSVIRATLLFYLTPIWSTLFGVAWLSERLTPGRVAAIGLGLLGLWLLLSGADAAARPLNIGDAFALGSGVFWAIGAAFMKKYPAAPTVTTSALQFAFAFGFSALASVFLFGIGLPDGGPLMRSFPIAFVAASLVLLPSLMVIFWASKQLFPGRVGVLMMSEALVAILSASLLLPDEAMSPWQWLGCVVILTACTVEVFTKDEAAA